jgi:amidohydrolase
MLKNRMMLKDIKQDNIETGKTDLLNHLIEIRRYLHQYPELGYNEHQTSEVVAIELDKLGIDYKRHVAGTGIIATLKNGVGKCIALRADMDALPLKEETGLPFSSKVNDVMHACGHDVHTTMLLGAAHQLKEMPFQGTVKFIFQPSEEGTAGDPENKSGGERIANSGELDDVSAALALHIQPLLEVGKISYATGQAMAGNTCFEISIQGKFGHAAFPHLGVDAIVVASQLIQSAQSIVTRYTSPTEPVVLSFTQIKGGVAPNVTAENVTLTGTIRTIDQETMQSVIERLELLLEGTSKSFGALITIHYDLRYPSLLNDAAIHHTVIPALHQVFGREGAIEAEPVMASEDFAFYSRKIPSMFYFLGARALAEDPQFLHHPAMIVNEDCIGYGVNFLTQAALCLLKK